MKIVVIGGSGLIGKKLVNNLRQHGQEVVAASPSSSEGLIDSRLGVIEDSTDSGVDFKDRLAA